MRLGLAEVKEVFVERDQQRELFHPGTGRQVGPFGRGQNGDRARVLPVIGGGWSGHTKRQGEQAGKHQETSHDKGCPALGVRL